MLKKSKWFISGIIFTLIMMCIVTASSEDIFKEISVIFNNIKIVLNGEELHTTDVNGKEVEPFIYEGTTYVPIRAVSEAFGKDVYWSDEEQKVTITDPITIAEDGSNLFPFRDGDLYGYMDINGKIRIEPQFDSVELFSEGYAVVEKFEPKIRHVVRGVIDIRGNMVIPFAPATIGDFCEGVAVTWELPHFTEKELEELGLNNGEPGLFVDSFGPLQKYYVDHKGDKLFDQTFIDAYNFSCGLALVNKAETYDEPAKWSYIDKSGSYATHTEYEYASSFNSEGYAVVQKNNKTYIIDTNFDIISYIDVYDGCYSFDSDLFKVRKGDKYGVINVKNKVIIPLEYNSLLGFNDGLYAAQKDGKFGYIDDSNNVIIPFEYDEAYRFYNELAIVKRKDGTNGLINKNGEFVFETTDELEMVSSKGMYCIGDSESDNVTYINKNLEIVVPHY